MCPSGGLCFLCDSSWQRVSLLKNEIRTLIKWEKSCPSSELLCLKAPFQSCLTLFLVFLHELFVCGTPEAVPKYHGLFRRKKIIEVLPWLFFSSADLALKMRISDSSNFYCTYHIMAQDVWKKNYCFCLTASFLVACGAADAQECSRYAGCCLLFTRQFLRGSEELHFNTVHLNFNWIIACS